MLLNDANAASRAAWQALVDKAEADTAVADAWGRWAALVPFADDPLPEALTAESAQPSPIGRRRRPASGRRAGAFSLSCARASSTRCRMSPSAC